MAHQEGESSEPGRGLNPWIVFGTAGAIVVGLAILGMFGPNQQTKEVPFLDQDLTPQLPSSSTGTEEPEVAAGNRVCLTGEYSGIHEAWLRGLKQHGKVLLDYPEGYRLPDAIIDFASGKVYHLPDIVPFGTCLETLPYEGVTPHPPVGEIIWQRQD